MKRMTTLIMILALCASLALAACSKLKKGDVEKDPAAAVADALALTAKGLCERLPAYNALVAAKDGGVVTLKLDSADLGVVLEAKSAYDTAARRVSGSYSLSADGEKVSVGLESANNKIAVTSPELFAGTYGADLSTVSDELRSSVVAASVTTFAGVDVIGIADSVVPILRMFTAEQSAMIHAALEKIKGDVKNCLNNASHSVEEKKITVGGEDVKAYEVRFDLTKKDVSDLLGAIKTAAGTYGDLGGFLAPGAQSEGTASDLGSLAEALEKAQTELAKDANDASASLVFELSPKSGELLSGSVSATLKKGGDSIAVDLSFDLGAEPSKSDKADGSLTVTETKDGKTSVCGATFTVERADGDKEFSRKLTVETVNTANGESETNKTVIDFRHDRETKNYTCTVDTDSDRSSGSTGGSSASKLTFGGTLDCTDTTLTLTVGKVSAARGGETSEIADLGLSVSLAPGEAIGAMPEYKNIAALDFEEVFDLSQEISENAAKLTKLGAKLAQLEDRFGLTVDDEDTTDSEPGDTTGPDGADDPGEDGDADAGDYIPEDMVSIYNDYDELYDYNNDGKLSDADREAWDSDYRPYGEEFDEAHDYDLDGSVGTDADRDAYATTRNNIMSVSGGETFNLIYAQFNEEHDYNGDGAVGTDADRADYELYYKPFADGFDPARDYDNDGIVDDDDVAWYDYIRSK